jgi:outer membrane protein
MGQAEAQDLGLEGGPLYDPLGNYRRVTNKWNDWTRDERYVPVATRTVDPAELPPNPIVTPDLIPGPVITNPPAAGTTSMPSVTPPQQ